MRCPTCGGDSVEGTEQCPACGQPLRIAKFPATQVDVRISRIAVAASVCTFLCGVFLVPGIISEIDPWVLHPRSGLAQFAGPLSLLAGGMAFLLGTGAWVHIAVSNGRRTGYGFAVIGAATPFFLFVGLLSLPTFGRGHTLSPRMRCGTNLAGIGKEMLIYANDYGDELPLAGGRGTKWGRRVNDWAAESRSYAFGLSPDGRGGEATISSSLYLLVRYCDLDPERFVCKGDRGTRPFDSNDYFGGRRGLASFWDFGPDPMRHCSYSYHMPYGPQRLTTSHEPGMAVAADRNPWMDGPRWKAEDFSQFQWNGTVEQQRMGNAMAHLRDGQNVLFLDSHVQFAKRSSCGLEDDNIYTRWNAQDKSSGTPPQFGSEPAGRKDSLLVNDPPVLPKSNVGAPARR